ncbi:hypothetical protein ABPG74_003824 [Tetrahymena malaccensis]
MKQIIFLLFSLEGLVSQILESNILGVYSPQQLNNLSNQNDSLWTPIQTKVVKDLDLVLVSCGYRGISIINKEGSQLLYSKGMNNSYVKSFESTSDGQYIYIGIQQNLVVYNLQFKNFSQSYLEMQNFGIIQNISFQTDIVKTNYNQQNELLAIAVQTGSISFYNTTLKNKFQLLSTFNTGSNQINSLFISQDGNWFYIANDVQGVFMMNLKTQQMYKANHTEQNSQQMIVAGHGNFGLRAYQVIGSKDSNYIYTIDFWQGFFYANVQEVINNNVDQYPIQLSFISYWPFQDLQKTCQSMNINQDESLLFLGVRSYGILILDIRNRDQIEVFELIKLDTLIFSIELSKQEEFLYVTTSDSFLTFTKDSPSLNEDLPNLFNTHQIKYQDFLNQAYKWRCYVDLNDQYLIGAFDSTGLYVFPFYEDPYMLDVNNYVHYDFYVDSIYLDKGNKYLIVPRYYSVQNIGIYQYAPLDDSINQQNISINNMKLIKDYSLNEIEISEMIVFSQDEKFAVQTYASGLIIYDSVDIFNLQILSRWNNLDFMFGENQGVCFSKDSKWIFSTIRFFGVYLLNVEDKTNPILTDYVRTNGGENVKISMLSNYIYLLDGVKGFAIIDGNQVPKLKIISRLQIAGYTNDVLFLKEENYALINELQRGFLTLIDISNKQFPQIINIMNYNTQYSMTSCLTQKAQHLFVTTSGGILVLPITSQVQIHTQVNLIEYNNQTGQKQIKKVEKISQAFNQNGLNLNQEYLFFVGQQIQFNFAILYPLDQYMEITQIFYYFNGQNEQIPSTFQFNQFEQSLQISVDTTLLNLNQVQPNLNILLIKTVIPLNSNAFIFEPEEIDDKYAVNATQSQLIYNYLCEKNIINNGFVVDQYDFSQPLNLESQFWIKLLDLSAISEGIYNQIISKITQQIQFTLMKSFYINPIKFYVQTSLFFDNENKFQFIKSNSQNVISINLSVLENDGKLIFNAKSSIMFQLSEQQDQLVIQGSLENINKVLRSKIIFVNKTQITAQNSPNITLKIIDNLNYPLIQQLSVYESQFIALKQQLQVNSENDLQKQFNNQFQGGIIDIDSDITFSFKMNTFLISDVQDITYQFFYLSSQNEYTQIPLNFWLQQINNNQLSFKGSTTLSMFQQSYTFKIIASDGYTQAEDTFTMNISGIPLSYILSLLFKIVGPIIFIIGLYQQRNIFFNSYFKQKVTFSQELAICDEFYLKKIIILDDIQRQSQEILSKLLYQIQQSKSEFDKDNYVQNEETKNKGTNNNQSFKNIFQNLQIEETQQKQSLLNLPELNNLYSEKFIKEIKILNMKKTQNSHCLFKKKEVLFADTLGFSSEEPSRFKVAFGQSLHIDPQNIKQVVAYKKKKINKWLRPLFRLLNIEYSLHGAYKNMRLPSWLSLDLKKGVIYLFGTPQSDDIDETLIRIYDNTGYVIQQFLLKVIQNPNKNGNQNDFDKIYEVADEIIYKNQLSQSKSIYLDNDQNRYYTKKSPSMLSSFFKSFINNSQLRMLDSSQIPGQKLEKAQIYEFRSKRNTKNIQFKNILHNLQSPTKSFFYNND